MVVLSPMNCLTPWTCLVLWPVYVVVVVWGGGGGGGRAGCAVKLISTSRLTNIMILRLMA